MRPPPPHVRGNAVKAFYWASGGLPVALMLLTQYTNVKPPSNPYTFISFWVNQFERRWSVGHDGPAARMTPTDAALAKGCCDLLEKGYTKATGEHRYFCKFCHALKHCPWLRQLREELQVSSKHLLRRLQAAESLSRSIELPTPPHAHLFLLTVHACILPTSCVATSCTTRP